MSSQPFNLRLHDKMQSHVSHISEALGVSRADYIRDLIRQDIERRNRFPIPAHEVSDDTLFFRAAHGDDGAMMELSCRVAEKIESESVPHKRFEMFGAAMVMMRLAAECGDGNANANLAAGLLLRSDAAREMGEHDFADSLQINAIARYNLALDRGAHDASVQLEQAISKARPSMVEAARSLSDAMASGLCEAEG